LFVGLRVSIKPSLIFQREGVMLSYVNVNAGIALYSQQRRNFLRIFQTTFYGKKFIWLE
jgi:hypothetical protein